LFNLYFERTTSVIIIIIIEQKTAQVQIGIFKNKQISILHQIVIVYHTSVIKIEPRTTRVFKLSLGEL
jgi:hypothetical protein